MKKIIMVVIVALLMLTCAVHANPPPPWHPSVINRAICHTGGENITNVYFNNWGMEDLTITATATGIPSKWQDGPVVPAKVTLPGHSKQAFQVRMSSEDINGNIWPAGNYTGRVILSESDGDEIVRIPIHLWIADCNDGPPDYPVPEFPVLPGISVLGIGVGIVAAMLGLAKVIQEK